MGGDDYHELAESVIESTPYLALGTTDGSMPWVAPIEFFRDDSGDFYFFSTTDSRHAEHIAANDTVAVALWGDQDQPEYDPDMSTSLNGVQIEGRAEQLAPEEHPPIVEGALDAVPVPMPPYAAFKVEPQRVYVPIIEDGINKRVEVDMG